MSDPTRDTLRLVEGTGRRESVLQRKLTLRDMLDLQTFTDLVKNFVELYKVGIKVFDEKGAKLADIKIGNGDFCGYVFSFPEGRHRCTATVSRVKDGPISPSHGARMPLSSEPPPGMIALPCFTGLRYLVTPIRWEGDSLGRVVFGPFTPDDLKELPLSLTEIDQGFDVARATPMMEKIRRAPEGTVVKVMAHFGQLLETLVAAGQKTYLTSQMHIEATLESNKELEARNKKLEEMNARLKELDRLKSSFLATVSHELRTPLTSIIGYSEMLAEGLAGPLNPEQVEYVRTIMEKGETLLKLISSILDVSQIEAGKLRLNFEPLNVLELVHGSVTSVKPQAQKKGVILETRLPPTQNLRVSADRDKLKQVLVNLLANAVKFTNKGGTVSLFLSEVGPQPELGADGYRIIVEDSGVGIPQDQFDKIFESFYQVDNSSTREFGGAGLGLAIVKSFVNGHGGQVRVSSEVGRGSRFTVVLPATPPQPRTTTVLPPAVQEAVPDRF
ncbi:MAG: PocR ligand-binding domain-containing protein [Myxococcaceae bacterium]|nr:PocR ligand-binding domain-containing protein [Myxococcaceae bacterium]